MRGWFAVALICYLCATLLGKFDDVMWLGDVSLSREVGGTPDAFVRGRCVLSGATLKRESTRASHVRVTSGFRQCACAEKGPLYAAGDSQVSRRQQQCSMERPLEADTADEMCSESFIFPLICTFHNPNRTESGGSVWEQFVRCATFIPHTSGAQNFPH